MAEKALYDNEAEQEFPFEAARDAFKWVPEYIDSLTPKRLRYFDQSVVYSALVNTLLVLTRARTSALITHDEYAVCSKFVRRLNATLESLPRSLNARHHRIEVLCRTKTSFFVTCERSPRFIRSRILTHHQVGQNLDYAAPGHINHTARPKSTVETVELHDPHQQVQLIPENLYLDTSTQRAAAENFYQKRTALFNDSMERLGLPYRFGHFWKDNTDDISQVLQFGDPPSPEWWARKYVFICDTPYGLSFVCEKTRYVENWEFLRTLYGKLPANQRFPRECSEMAQAIIEDLNKQLRDGKVLSTDLPESLFTEVDSPAYRHVKRSGLECFLTALNEVVIARALKRWQSKRPLNQKLDIGEEWYNFGHEIWCEDPLKISFKSVFSRKFWFREVEIY